MTDKTFRSIGAFKKHYLPKTYEREKMEELMKDPAAYGKWLAQKMIQGLREATRKALAEKGVVT